MNAWSAWFPDVRPHVRGCPDLVIAHEVRRAAQVLVSKAKLYRVRLDPVAVPALSASVQIAMPDASLEAVQVDKVWLDGRLLDPTTADDLDAMYSDDWSTHTGTPTHWYQMQPGVVGLYPTPDTAAATGLVARVFAAPSESATGIDDAIAAKYRDQIAAGAKGRLMLYPNVEWSNPQMGAALLGAFGSAVEEATVYAAKSFGAARVSTRKPAWC